MQQMLLLESPYGVTILIYRIQILNLNVVIDVTSPFLLVWYSLRNATLRKTYDKNDVFFNERIYGSKRVKKTSESYRTKSFRAKLSK